MIRSLSLFLSLVGLILPLAAFADTLTAAEEVEVLSLINQVRADVAEGLVGSQPSATNMSALVWDPLLAQVAQDFADTCTVSTNTDRTSDYLALGGSTIFVGETGYWYGTVGGNDFPSAAVPTWLAQESTYTYSGFSGIAPLYTQLVWANTRRVGCAQSSSVCPGVFDNAFICNYADSGNFFGLNPYESGPTATNCPIDLPEVEAGLCVAGSAPPAVPALPSLGWAALVGGLSFVGARRLRAS